MNSTKTMLNKLKSPFPRNNAGLQPVIPQGPVNPHIPMQALAIAQAPAPAQAPNPPAHVLANYLNQSNNNGNIPSQ